MKKTNKKIVRKFAVALAAVMAMTTAGAIGASADNSALNSVPKVKGWYTSIYDTAEFKELVRNDRLWQLYIPFHQSHLHAPSEPPCRLTRATFTEVESDVDECYAYQNEQLSRTS